MNLAVVVGPAPCQGCRSNVVYAYTRNGLSPRWRDPQTGHPHHCYLPKPRARLYRPEWDCGEPTHRHHSTPAASRCAARRLTGVLELKDGRRIRYYPNQR